MENLKVLIFDFDGVIFDSESLHLQAFNEVLKNHDITISEEDYYKNFISFDDKGVFEKLIDDKQTVDQLIKDKNNFFEKYSIDNGLLFDGVCELIEKLSSKYILCIGSGAKRSEILSILKKFNLESFFEVIISADDVNYSKPNPETFQKVIDILNESENIRATDCLVIEDTPGGIMAAKSADMYCASITNTFDESLLKDADFIFNSYHEIEDFLLLDID